MQPVVVDTIPSMAKKNPQPPEGEKRGPGRPQGAKPTVPIYARVPPELMARFQARVDNIKPETTVTAVIKMLIEEYLKRAEPEEADDD